MKIRKTVPWVLVGSLGVVLSLGGCFLFPKEEEKLAPPLVEPAAIAYETYTAKRGTIIDDFQVIATISYAHEQNVFFAHRGGRLERIAVANADTVKKGQLLAELDTDPLKYEIAMQELAVQKARLLEQRAALLSTDRFQQQIAAIETKQAELTLENDRSELSKAQLYAPLDGTVVWVSRLAAGDQVDAYATIVRLADTRSLELTYTGSESLSFSFGMAVEVSYRDRIYAGTVVQTPSSAPPDAPEAERNRVVISVKALPPGAAAGDTVTVRVELQRREKVIVLPRRLVQISDGQNFVNVLSGGVKKQVPVQVGITSATETEIRKGLVEGDEVIEW